MRAKREMDEGIRLVQRERGKLAAIGRAFERAIFGPPANEIEDLKRQRHEAEHFSGKPVRGARNGMTPNWSWWKGKE